jgi:hypothetical protein
VDDNQVWRSAAADWMAIDRHQRPPLRAIFPDRGDVAAWAVESARGFQPGVEQRVAPSKRSNCLFDIVRPNPHGQQDSARWLKSGCFPLRV